MLWGHQSPASCRFQQPGHKPGLQHSLALQFHNHHCLRLFRPVVWWTTRWVTCIAVWPGETRATVATGRHLVVGNHRRWTDWWQVYMSFVLWGRLHFSRPECSEWMPCWKPYHRPLQDLPGSSRQIRRPQAGTPSPRRVPPIILLWGYLQGMG